MNGILSFYECRFSRRHWKHYHMQKNLLNFLHLQVAGMQKSLAVSARTEPPGETFTNFFFRVVTAVK